jgi:hypothetical protein
MLGECGRVHLRRQLRNGMKLRRVLLLLLPSQCYMYLRHMFAAKVERHELLGLGLNPEAFGLNGRSHSCSLLEQNRHVAVGEHSRIGRTDI